ncbi:hypothetical protein MNBD_CHLOROFLEXI01-3581, partial [hydrothermal vent metagenome]
LRVCIGYTFIRLIPRIGRLDFYSIYHIKTLLTGLQHIITNKVERGGEFVESPPRLLMS